jgi:hypothetical protein
MANPEVSEELPKVITFFYARWQKECNLAATVGSSLTKEVIANRTIMDTPWYTKSMYSSLDSVTKLALLEDDSPHDQIC